MKKKRIVSLSLIVALIAIIAGGTYAYFTDTDDVENTFTVGNVKIEIDEPNWTEPVTAQPGVKYAKDPAVKNTGANDAYVRTKIILSDKDAFIKAAVKHGLGESDLPKVFGELAPAPWKLISAENKVDTIEFTYLYDDVLVPTGRTKPLFKNITIPGVFDNRDMEALDGQFNITIESDAIQADGFADAEEAFVAFDETNEGSLKATK